MRYTIAAFYHFTPIADIASLRDMLLAKFQGLVLCGTILVAPEGINGTVGGSENDVAQMLKILGTAPGLDQSAVKYSSSDDVPFKRFKIRLKKEIITFRQSGADPEKFVATRVAPEDWNSVVADPAVLLLDTRNKYETKIGIFRGARDPQIEQFTDFAAYVRANLDPKIHKKVAMYCTGGIRCEKASAFMLSEGFETVYHLSGGVLKYLENVPADESKWDGECYVFDRRIAVGHGLTTGRFTMCFYCGAALREEDKEHPLFEEGVSCASCHDLTTGDMKAACRTRHEQLTSR